MKNPQAIALGAAIFAASMGGLATSQPLPSSTAATPDPKASPLSDDAFVRAVQRSNDKEIAASRSVLKSTKSAAVRDFATSMIADHSTANVSLQTAARNAHVALADLGRGTPMDSASHTMMEPSGDRAYLQEQVAAHKDALAALTAYASNGTNAVLRTYASAQVPIVQSHLDKAQNDLAMMPGRPNAGASVAPIPPGGVDGGSKNGGQIAPNPSASPVAASSSSPNPQPSIGVPNTPGPLVSASPRP